MLLFIRLAVEEEVSVKYTLNQLFIYCYSFILHPQAQLPESLPAFSISTEKKGKKGGRGKDRDNIACVHVYAHVKGVG